MANINTKKGVIGILTGGGDVPGLNPAIRVAPCGRVTRLLAFGVDGLGWWRWSAITITTIRRISSCLRKS